MTFERVIYPAIRCHLDNSCLYINGKADKELAAILGTANSTISPALAHGVLGAIFEQINFSWELFQSTLALDEVVHLDDELVQLLLAV